MEINIVNLKILGCGPIIQNEDYRNCSGYLIDNNILLDCGPGIWQALNRSKINIAQLYYLYLSHFHVDHVADIAPILMARYLTLSESEYPLQITGPVGIAIWFQNVKLFCGNWIEKIPVILKEADPEMKIPGYHIKSGNTDHSDNSLCYRITDNNGISLFYSGDTGYNSDLFQIAKGAHMAVIEASNKEETIVPGHLTPRLAGQIAEESGVKKLILTHRYPEVSETYAIEQSQLAYKGEVLIARDNMSINVNET